MDALDPTEMDTFAQEKGRRGQAGPLELQGESLSRKEEEPTQGDTDRRKAWGGPGAGTGARKGRGRDPQLELLRGSQCCLFGSRSMMLS